MYKKIYVEITNNCNLNCDFCIKNRRKNKFMSIEEFKIVLNKIENHTNYLYLHVLGEPLLHPDINEFINYASLSYKINITTNGYLIDRIKENNNIRQLNISLHSYDEKYGICLEDYMNNIFDSIDKLKKYTYISFRFWVNNKYTNRILDMINDRYNTTLKIDTVKNNSTISKNIFISKQEEFIWPSVDNNFDNSNETCYALKDHIGILVDGTVIPCCMDTLGYINLGNIYNDSLENIKNSDRYKRMLEGFKNNKRVELLCKKCKYKAQNLKI